jgi:hypothetical protein
MPCYEGGVQAFECYILPSETRVYITVEREGAILVYDCYRDEEVSFSRPSWSSTHSLGRCGHELMTITKSALVA